MSKTGKILQCIILLAGIIMLLSGIMMNDFKEVWSKAVMICMECIGIG
ncbi:CD1871A family CXXC motif-containing protein [Butyrivibrio sp. WCD3002]|nr:CD1871A family CXXC motif-containing protein [Butyrivibrio sp. WCD3002]